MAAAIAIKIKRSKSGRGRDDRIRRVDESWPRIIRMRRGGVRQLGRKRYF
jgi:hypothetical protein